ncbi:F-box protein PP2-A11 [Cardamine amara subsp. amara]|uniref:F-box protein PP2-A11 n=1 Tax=Cardamine amara subsp. amara TaxID=228776 RepID=A0ABD0ZNH7_CARAN
MIRIHLNWKDLQKSEHPWKVEIDGEIDFPFPPGSYSVFFRLQLGKPGKRFGWRVCDTQPIHGWDIKPAWFQVWTGDGQHSSSQCMLKEQG